MANSRQFLDRQDEIGERAAPALLRQTMMASKFAGAEGDKSVSGKMR
jgi:hypothetical protein